MRKYKAPDVMWGGDPTCEHEWQEVPQDLLHENRNNRRGTQEEVSANPTGTTYIRKFRGQPHGSSAKVGNQLNDAQPPELPSGAFCSKCSAWLGQLGLEPNYHSYLDHLLLITAELKRVLKPTGTLWWNMGDSYAGSNQGSGATHKSPHGIQDVTKGYYAADTNRKTPLAHQDMPSKSLMQLPTRFAIRMADEQGWILRNTLIWRKRNHMPSSVKDRLSNGYEFIFFFTKQKHYFFNLDAVRVPNKVMGVTDMRPPNILTEKLYSNSSYNKSDDSHLAQFQIGNRNRKQYLISRIYKLAKEIRGRSKYNTTATGNFLEGEIFAKSNRDALNILQQQENLTAEELNFLKDYTQNHYGHPLGKNPGDVLELTTQPFKGAHFAVFPPKLPEFCIKAGSPEEVCSVCGKPKVPIYEPLIYSDYGKNEVVSLNDNPYAVKERRGTVAFRKIPNIEDFRMFLKHLKQEKNITIDEIESKMQSQAPHHWFNGESFPSKEEWLKFKLLFGVGETPYDESLTKEYFKPAEKLASPEIVVGTKPTCTCNAPFEPGVVLDPFAGSGTTMMVASQLSRSAIGIEISEEYAKLIKRRLVWGFHPDIEWKEE